MTVIMILIDSFEDFDEDYVVKHFSITFNFKKKSGVLYLVVVSKQHFQQFACQAVGTSISKAVAPEVAGQEHLWVCLQNVLTMSHDLACYCSFSSMLFYCKFYSEHAVICSDTTRCYYLTLQYLQEQTFHALSGSLFQSSATIIMIFFSVSNWNFLCCNLCVHAIPV